MTLDRFAHPRAAQPRRRSRRSGHRLVGLGAPAMLAVAVVGAWLVFAVGSGSRERLVIGTPLVIVFYILPGLIAVYIPYLAGYALVRLVPLLRSPRDAALFSGTMLAGAIALLVLTAGSPSRSLFVIAAALIPALGAVAAAGVGIWDARGVSPPASA